MKISTRFLAGVSALLILAGAFAFSGCRSGHDTDYSSLIFEMLNSQDQNDQGSQGNQPSKPSDDGNKDEEDKTPSDDNNKNDDKEPVTPPSDGGNTNQPSQPSNPPVSGNKVYSKEQLLSAMGNGWNLGNTLDAKTDGSGTDNLGLSTETSWGMPYTTQRMIKEIAKAGFKTIRIPVSWHNHITDRNTYKIDSGWMARVKQIVDWSLDANLVVIINIHHDNLSESDLNSGKNVGFCVSSNSSFQTKSIAYITSVWKQVAETFINYDNRLIFEVLNEPRYVGTNNDGFSPSDSEIKTANPIIRKYEQAALDQIRKIGGKNSSRFIMVAPYAASPYKLDNWSLPNDSVSGKLIVSVHAYDPYEFAMGTDNEKYFTESHKGSLDYLFGKVLYENFRSKGIPVVMGEASVTDKNNLSERKKWFEYYCGKAKQYKIPVILWDNMVTFLNGGKDPAERHGYFDRNNCSWLFPELIRIITR